MSVAAESLDTQVVHAPHARIVEHAEINSLERYQQLYNDSINQPDEFWKRMAQQHLEWFAPFNKVRQGTLQSGDVAWFVNGKLNVCYNCVDRHVAGGRGSKTAILFEGDEPNDIRRVTYSELLKRVCCFANVLKRQGVRKGDTVAIYMPMVPEAVIAMLACARIGSPHSVIFAGFSSDALRDRIVDAQAKFVITADEGVRGGKKIPLKAMADKAIAELSFVTSVIVYRHTGVPVAMKEGRDKVWQDLEPLERPYCPCEPMDSEDTLFYLYTSGSTGKPKGIVHTTAGYLLHTTMTTRYVFDLKDSDIYACVADVGWITGHSYVVYGPLSNGATTFMFESTPTFPDAGRYWAMVQRHKINILYTAPTAIRALMKFGDEFVKKYDRSSLRVLGSVGEPINPEAWRWYYNVVGDGRCAIVDTFWQTETGGHVITPLPGATPLKPGSATFPFFGIRPVIVDQSGNVLEGNNVKGVLCFSEPWPGMARTIFGDHGRYLQTYMSSYAGLYFTGDGCMRDKDGYYWITGRVDDVINVSGHRIGSAEIESALVSYLAVAESACIGIPHEIKGQGLLCYVTLKNGVTPSDALVADLKKVVREQVGAFATPDVIVLCPALPKTRSGKIMRRVLRKIACNEADQLGDTSTLAEPAVVPELISLVAAAQQQLKK